MEAFSNGICWRLLILYYLLQCFNKKLYTYFLKNKFDVFDTFKKYKVMVEAKTDLKLKCLKYNNEGECIDEGFKNYCFVNDINIKRLFWAHCKLYTYFLENKFDVFDTFKK
jgi:hypothetical protein